MFLNKKIFILSTIIMLSVHGCVSQKPINVKEPLAQLNYLILGCVEDDGVIFSIKMSGETKLELIIFEEKTKKEVVKRKIDFPGRKNFVHKEKITGLQPETVYTYELMNTSKLLLQQGRFQTLPLGPASYKIAFGSCANTGSASDIFVKIKDENPLFFLNTGDIHYENIGDSCLEKFDKAYEKVFSSVTQSKLYAEVPLVYMWDDHDFGPNNTDSSNPCRKESVASYKKHLPHYPMAIQSEIGPISQNFEVGRVVFMLTDLRSQKVRPQLEGCQKLKPGTNFGNEDHLQWFFQSMLKTKNEGKVVAWISSYSWINAEGGPNYKCTETDNWGGYPEERQQIADFIKKHQIPVFILSGDAHMVAIDDGKNSDYATGGGAPIPVFHAAALDRYGSYKGGPYSNGYSTVPAQYGIMEVEDHGGHQICFHWYGKNKEGNIVKNQNGDEIKLDFCFDLSIK
ncbi:MAG: alkaline phosphatase D family protein [Saprospiraceae bacterium]